MIIDDSPCAMKLGSSNYDQVTSTMESPLNHSIYGFVVFLVIFTFFSALVAGLLFCLTKIWCTRPTSDPAAVNQKLRDQILRSPVYMGDSDSDEESTIQQTVDSANNNNNIHMSQKVLSYVHKSLTDINKRDLEFQKSCNEADGAVSRCANVAAGHVLAFVGSESPLLAPPPSLHPPMQSRLPSCLKQSPRRSLPFYSPRHIGFMSRSSTAVEL